MFFRIGSNRSSLDSLSTDHMSMTIPDNVIPPSNQNTEDYAISPQPLGLHNHVKMESSNNCDDVHTFEQSASSSASVGMGHIHSISTIFAINIT